MKRYSELAKVAIGNMRPQSGTNNMAIQPVGKKGLSKKQRKKMKRRGKQANAYRCLLCGHQGNPLALHICTTHLPAALLFDRLEADDLAARTAEIGVFILKLVNFLNLKDPVALYYFCRKRGYMRVPNKQLQGRRKIVTRELLKLPVFAIPFFIKHMNYLSALYHEDVLLRLFAGLPKQEAEGFLATFGRTVEGEPNVATNLPPPSDDPEGTWLALLQRHCSPDAALFTFKESATNCRENVATVGYQGNQLETPQSFTQQAVSSLPTCALCGWTEEDLSHHYFSTHLPANHNVDHVDPNQDWTTKARDIAVFLLKLTHLMNMPNPKALHDYCERRGYFKTLVAPMFKNRRAALSLELKRLPLFSSTWYLINKNRMARLVHEQTLVCLLAELPTEVTEKFLSTYGRTCKRCIRNLPEPAARQDKPNVFLEKDWLALLHAPCNAYAGSHSCPTMGVAGGVGLTGVQCTEANTFTSDFVRQQPRAMEGRVSLFQTEPASVRVRPVASKEQLEYQEQVGCSTSSNNHREATRDWSPIKWQDTHPHGSKQNTVTILHRAKQNKASPSKKLKKAGNKLCTLCGGQPENLTEHYYDIHLPSALSVATFGPEQDITPQAAEVAVFLLKLTKLVKMPNPAALYMYCLKMRSMKHLYYGALVLDEKASKVAKAILKFPLFASMGYIKYRNSLSRLINAKTLIQLLAHIPREDAEHLLSAYGKTTKQQCTVAEKEPVDDPEDTYLLNMLYKTISPHDDLFFDERSKEEPEELLCTDGKATANSFRRPTCNSNSGSKMVNDLKCTRYEGQMIQRSVYFGVQQQETSAKAMFDFRASAQNDTISAQNSNATIAKHAPKTGIHLQKSTCQNSHPNTEEGQSLVQSFVNNAQQCRLTTHSNNQKEINTIDSTETPAKLLLEEFLLETEDSPQANQFSVGETNGKRIHINPKFLRSGRKRKSLESLLESIVNKKAVINNQVHGVNAEGMAESSFAKETRMTISDVKMEDGSSENGHAEVAAHYQIDSTKSLKEQSCNIKSENTEVIERTNEYDLQSSSHACTEKIQRNRAEVDSALSSAIVTGAKFVKCETPPDSAEMVKQNTSGFPPISGSFNPEVNAENICFSEMNSGILDKNSPIERDAVHRQENIHSQELQGNTADNGDGVHFSASQEKSEPASNKRTSSEMLQGEQAIELSAEQETKRTKISSLLSAADRVLELSLKWTREIAQAEEKQQSENPEDPFVALKSTLKQLFPPSHQTGSEMLDDQSGQNISNPSF